MLGCLVLTTLVASATPTPARALTMRRAERVIDRALVAEIADDFDGAAKAVEEIIKTASSPEEAAPSARLKSWLVGLKARQEAFRLTGRTALGYAEAFETLRPFGARRSDLYWRRATQDVAGLERKTAAASVACRFDRVLGMESTGEVKRRLGLRLKRSGLGSLQNKGKAIYQARFTIDATEAKAHLALHEVTAEGSFVLRSNADRRLVGSFAKRRSVQRRQEDGARRFAIWRLVDDIGRALVFQIRQDTLRQMAGPAARTED